MVPLARQGCLWARGLLRDRFLLHFLTILGSFSKDSGVDFEAVWILLLIVAALGFCSWSSCFGIFLVMGFVGFGGEGEGEEK